MSYVDKVKLPEKEDKRKKLMDYQKDEIRELIRLGHSDLDIAFEYSVSRTTIYLIRKPLKYNEVLEGNKRNHKKMSKDERRKYMASLRSRKQDLA